MKETLHKLNSSGIWVVAGVILLFSTAIAVTLIAPRFVDTSWTSPSSPYQVQMYEIEDPNYYISSAASGGKDLLHVHHLQEGLTLLAFKESRALRIVAPKELEQYITTEDDPHLKLTTKLLLLREPVDVKKTPEETSSKTDTHQEILELYVPQKKEVFSIDLSEWIVQNWVDEPFTILVGGNKPPYYSKDGVIFVQNPKEFRITSSLDDKKTSWHYDPKGRPVKNIAELTGSTFQFRSRKELIEEGEQIYAIEGCWYCHTDQTRTLIADVVANGSDAFPAPPSSANEFIYQKITFPGTRRIGPDLSREGVTRPSREWHKAHFWSPGEAVPGSIMPAFRHFFHEGNGKEEMDNPNHRFEAIYQYLMTKGTRITPPTKSWWLGADPIRTKEIIEGQRKLP